MKVLILDHEVLVLKEFKNLCLGLEIKVLKKVLITSQYLTALLAQIDYILPCPPGN